VARRIRRTELRSAPLHKGLPRKPPTRKAKGRPKGTRMPRGGRNKFPEQQDRLSYVVQCISKRLTYPEIAKAVADEYKITRKNAYNYLNRLVTRAGAEMEEKGIDLTNVFQRIVLSVEDSIRMAKAGGDHKGAIAGESLLAKVYGFDKGLFIAALERQRKLRRKSKKVDLIEGGLAEEMHSLTNQQMQKLLTDTADSEAVEEVVDG